ncbi:MAG: lysozyme [Promicromonosporaceae bacterium]|nr:lysozyme [Promicromonosporaceae bacterium]
MVSLIGVGASSLLASADRVVSQPISTNVMPFLDAAGNRQSIGQNGLKLIEQYEGLELTGYLLGDGKCTIGYGHAVDVAAKPNCTSWTISQAEAEAFLAEDVSKFGDVVNDYFDRSFNQNQFDALVSFSYNVGNAFAKYSWPTSPEDAWFPGVLIQYTNPPQFKDGLTRRRNAEIALFQDTASLPAAGISAMSAPTQSSATVPDATVTDFPAIRQLFSGSINGR